MTETTVDFALPAPAEAFRDELRAWLAANLSDEVVQAGRLRGASDDAFARLRRWDRTVADAGWAALSWPVEYGGRGATVLEQLVFTEETTAAGAPMPVNVIGINNIAPAIMEHGTEAQKVELLPRMLRADDVWCQGMSEPEAGSDLASLRTRAVADGDCFVVDGQKTWTSLAHRADWCQLFARTDPDAAKHKGISCLLVDMATSGIEVRPLRSLSGDSEFNEVFFDAVRVPAANLLGPLHGGWGVATSTLTHERAGAARLYSSIRVRLGDLVDDLERVHGAGRPVLDDPLVLDRLGGLSVRLQLLEVLCKRAVSRTLAGGDPSAQASLAKTVWGELDQDVAALAHDVLGADDPAGRWAVARTTSRSLTIAGGTTQVNKNITAQRVLGLPRFVNLEPSDEQQALRATVRRMLAAEAPVAGYVRRVVDGEPWTRDLTWGELAALGATGLLVPADRGGLGLGVVEATMVAEELGRALYPGPWAATAVGATRALVAVGGEAAGALLAGIAAGDVVATLGLEPPADVLPRRGDAFAVDGERLTGALASVPGAVDADVVLVVAGGALHAVERADAGVEAVASIDRTQRAGAVRLDRAPTRRLGPIEPTTVAAVVDDVLVVLAADALGAAQAVLDVAVQYAKDRHQFGQPIGAFQAVQHLCVDALETVELARGGVLHAAWAADADVPERHVAALRCKAFADRLATVADTAIQVLGGIGYTWEHDAHLWFKRLLTWSTTLGPPSAYRVALGRQLRTAR